VVVKIVEKFVQERVPVPLRDWCEGLRCRPVLGDRLSVELFFFRRVKEFLFIESYISGQDNLIELGDPDAIDIAGVVANQISDVCSWAKLELIDVFPGLVSTVQGICLASICIDPVPVWSEVFCCIKVDVWWPVPSKVLVKPTVHLLLGRHPPVPPSGKNIVYPNGCSVEFWPEFLRKEADHTAHSNLVDTTRSLRSTCWFLGLRRRKFDVYSGLCRPDLELRVPLER
jgi:hypothetical protein